MININNLTMGFTERTLFKDVSFSIFPNEKIGLTGPNGAGKTTLFSIVLGDMEPVAGSVQIQKNIKIGYLPQEVKFSSERTVMEELTEGDDHIKKLMNEKRKLEDNEKAGSDRYGDVLHQLEVLGIYDLEHRAEKILTGLGFKEEEFHKPVLQLSGGWQMRTLLAKLLTYSYDLLLLDEPTNYLDLSATIWLKQFLYSYNGAFVLISHDRLFLNDVTNYTIILEGAQITKLKGNYEAYEEQKASQQKSLAKRQKVVEKKRQQLERFTQRFHAQPNLASAVRNKKKMIERLEKIELDRDTKSIGSFDFTNVKPSGYVVSHLTDVSKSYGEKKVYAHLDYEIIKGQKVCLVGPNGAGKSTLLKMLAGNIEPDSGTIKIGHQVDRGYFSQTRMDVLNPNNTAFEEVIKSAPKGLPAVKARSLLGLFNYRGDDVFKQVKILSGGEKSRLILAKLLINPPNFMLLDEPTTHLDLDGVKALTTAFQQYEGTICFISHDLFFIREIADSITEVEGGSVKNYPGGLEYYLDKKGHKDTIQSKKKSSNKGGNPSKNAPKGDGKAEKLNVKTTTGKSEASEMYQKHKQAKKRKNQIKNELKRLEKELKKLETESYVKARFLSKSLGNRDAAVIKEYGKRLKDIQTRQREIEKLMREMREENQRIEK